MIGYLKLNLYSTCAYHILLVLAYVIMNKHVTTSLGHTETVQFKQGKTRLIASASYNVYTYVVGVLYLTE